MQSNALHLVCSCLAMVILTLVVGVFMLFTRVSEMRSRRIPPQSASTTFTMGSKLEDVRRADNFRNLFEVPVLFYCLVAIALAVGRTPDWLISGCWLFVALRAAHSVIHCTYNKVYHRLTAFVAGFGLVVGMWITFAVSLASARTT